MKPKKKTEKTEKTENPTATVDVTREFGDVLVSRIDPSPYQTRRDVREIEELAASITAHGIICPVTVRWMPGWRYELVAGHRRLAAARQVGLESVPAIILRDCSDREAAELCVVENMQRCDLTPLEEAHGIQALLDTGHTAQDVADRLGRSRQWVARRTNLLNLCEEVIEAVGDADDPMSLAPVAVLEAIAAMPEGVQRELLEGIADDYYHPTLANMTTLISKVMCDLKRAPFDTADCSACLSRTGAQPDLFDDGETSDLGRCLLKTCYDGKRKQAIQAKLDEIRDKDESAIVVSQHYAIRSEIPDVEPFYEFGRAKKGEKDAVKAWEIDADGAVEPIYLKRHDWTGANGSNGGAKAIQPTAQQKAEAKVCRYVELLINKAPSESGEHPFAGRKEAEILRIVAVTGTVHPMDFGEPSAWARAWNAMTHGEIEDALWKCVKPVLFRRVKYDTITRSGEAYQEAVAIARYVFEIGPDDLEQQAAAWNEK